jgi:predicted lactoylglutathione lyase
MILQAQVRLAPVSHGFQDLDGHIWEVGWMDPAHVLPY